MRKQDFSTSKSCISRAILSSLEKASGTVHFVLPKKKNRNSLNTSNCAVSRVVDHGLSTTLFSFCRVRISKKSSLLQADFSAALPDHIYMDHMGFGMGCCCLQVRRITVFWEIRTTKKDFIRLSRRFSQI